MLPDFAFRQKRSVLQSNMAQCLRHFTAQGIDGRRWNERYDHEVALKGLANKLCVPESAQLPVQALAHRFRLRCRRIVFLTLDKNLIAIAIDCQQCQFPLLMLQEQIDWDRSAALFLQILFEFAIMVAVQSLSRRDFDAFVGCDQIVCDALYPKTAESIPGIKVAESITGNNRF